MKAEDLMIGDWVHSKLHNVDTMIECVGDEPGLVETRSQCVWLTSKECWERHYLNEIEPIPLTAEIVEKNGFRCKEEYAKYEWYEGNCEVWVILCSNEYGEKLHVVHIEDWQHGIIPKLYHNTITSVHELQHALKMCGIKKEIVL